MMNGTKEEMDGTNSIQHLKKKKKKYNPYPKLSETFIIFNQICQNQLWPPAAALSITNNAHTTYCIVHKNCL